MLSKHSQHVLRNTFKPRTKCTTCCNYFTSTITIHMQMHRRTGQHPFGGADRVLPEWIRWGGGGRSSRHFPRPIRWGGVVAEFFPLTAVTYPQFVLFKHVLCFARIMSTLCPNVCRQTARIGGAAAPPLPPVPYAYVEMYAVYQCFQLVTT